MHDEYDGAQIQVIEVYSSNDENNIKRQKFHQNMGYAEASVFSVVQILNKNTSKVTDGTNENN